ncbi:alpha-amylase family glycosyl hydrolase [Aquibacillus rhizosphaerae]|uniref:Alpha-amylase family glycosyl hydrolase n=1 Tax=Aquibacillus rhizosphaerae TaxID=3051431 RepID=A0ABT7LAI7_9BACI|nr:alpha-amylase family glycosyl hydrolase [Aquibacillus sp. LR5S19]MDL4842877.1 alpha-amylase family glycosyl hydrolase [Aquibacillus sp. LR5S19]
MKKNITLILSLLVFLGLTTSVYADEDSNWKDETVYYILVDRFVNGDSENDYNIDINDASSFHGGDIQGIINRLDYIKELGFTTINLSPIMSNDPKGYHGFLIDDFQKINEQFGTMEDVRELVRQARDRDLKVILDFVVTHVSEEHSWLTSNPTWIEDNKDLIWGDALPTPALDKPVVSDYFMESASYWINQTDVDGYRLYIDSSTPNQFISDFATYIKSQDSNLIVFTDTSDQMVIDHAVASNEMVINHEVSQVMSTVFSKSGNSLEPLVEFWDGQNNQRGLYMDSLVTPRFTREAVKQGENPLTRWKLALTYLYTIPGTPIIYQGSETTMDNGMDAPDHRMAQLNSGDEELKNYMEQLAAIRKQFPAITKGDIELVENNDGMTMFKRTFEGETIYVAINNDTETKTITLSDVPEGMQLTGLLQDNIVRKQQDGVFKIALERETADIFMIEEDTGINWLFVSFVVLVLGGFVTSVVILSRKSKKQEK